MYIELEKYKTGKKVPTIFNVGNNGVSLTVYLDEYTADLGELLNDFIEHKNKPFWKRKYYHKHLTKLYLQMLNKVSITSSW
jgi:hypothetical protein